MNYGFVGFITVCAVIIAGGLIWRVSLQNTTRSARAKIDPTTSVDELFKAEIGGIQQWIHARGVHRSDPVLLYVHGGPGTPMMPFEGLFQNPLEDHFIVVHWDQHERTVISLGAEPVILGSSPEAHLYLPKEKGFPPVTAIVTFRDGKVEMENKLTKSTHTLHGGNKLEIGSLMIEIQTDA